MALQGVMTRDIVPFLFHELTNAEEPAWVSAISGSPVSSDQESETYGGLTSVRPLEEWHGTRKVQEVSPLTYTLANVEYQTALRILKKEMRRDKTGQIERRIADLRRRWVQHWRRLISSVIKLGETQNCYDGTTYFATGHSEGKSGSQSNKVTVTGLSSATAPTATDAEKVVWTLVQKLLELKDDTGEPVNPDATSFVLMVPPSLLQPYAGALKAEILVEGNGSRSNILIAYNKFTFDLVANPYLATAIGAAAWTTKVALFVANGAALIRQNEVEIEMSAKAEGSDFAHDQHMHEYGVSCSRAAGYGRWQDAIMGIQST